MQPQLSAETEAQTIQTEQQPASPRWSPTRRVAFRFLFSYFVLFFLTGQEIAHVPLINSWLEKYTALWYTLAVWIGRRLFHITYDFPMLGMGSGDTTFRWILLPCYLTVAGVATVVWSLLDRRRTDDEKLHQWFRLLLRFSLGLALIGYGIAKAIPNQMIAPRPFMLLQPYGELTPMRVLWLLMGSSPPYQTFTGLAELLGGVLLLVPRTVLLGSLVCIADMTMVFVLNMCFDVPVKIMSFHYLLMALLLAAPDLRRLADLFLFNRPVAPAEIPPLSFRRWLPLAQVLFLLYGLFTISMSIPGSIERYRELNPPKPPLYGAWSVEEFAVNGEDVPLFAEDPDPDRWRWVIFQNPGEMAVKLMIESYKGFPLELDMEKKTMILGNYERDAEGKVVRDADGKRRKAPGRQGTLSFSEPEPHTLLLEGEVDGRRIRARLRRMALTADRFHWIRDPLPEEQ